MAGTGETKKARGEHARWIGDTAEQAARHLLQVMKLRPRAEDRDDGEDIVVEIVNGIGHLERIYVQVKGAENWKTGANGAWRVPVRQNAIARYRQLAHPVFLIAVDVATDEIRFLDLTGQLGYGPLETRRYEVPSANQIDRESGAELRRAMRMAADARRFSAVPATMAQRDQELSAIDPRIAVSSTATSRGIEIRLAARQEVQGFLRVSADPEHMDELVRSIGYGRSAQVPVRSVEIDGSPLFDAIGMGTATGFGVEARPKVMTGALGWMDENGVFQPEFDAQLSAYIGARGISLDIHSEGSPLEIQLEGDFGVPGVRARVNFGAGWIDEVAAELPYLEETERFVAALAEGRRFAFAERRHGRFGEPQSFGSSSGLRTYAESLLATVRLAAVLARVGRELAPSIRIRNGHLDEEEMKWLVLIDLVLRDGCADAGEVLANVTLDNPEEFSSDNYGPALLTSAMELKLWGQIVAFVPMVVEISAWSVEGPDAAGGCVLRSTAGTATRVRRISDADRAQGLAI